MDIDTITRNLAGNRETFHAMLGSVGHEEAIWKPDPKKWCLLEVVCHLYDEEREDFRARANHLLLNPGVAPPLFDQEAWVTERKYMEQDYNEKLEQFLAERAKSVEWLQSLESPPWHHAFRHEKRGEISAGYYMTNWLAHDLLHMRQIIKIRYLHLQQSSNLDLNYAGAWQGTGA